MQKSYQKSITKIPPLLLLFLIISISFSLACCCPPSEMLYDETYNFNVINCHDTKIITPTFATIGVLQHTCNVIQEKVLQMNLNKWKRFVNNISVKGKLITLDPN